MTITRPPTFDGENLLASVVHALQSNRDAWNKTLLVVTFDEHGGTFDHVAPPWGAVAPDSHAGTWTFKFDRFGVRVPTLLISPWIPEKTVFRSETGVPYDHTSIIATVFKWKNIPRPSGLGARVAAAPTFENVLTLTTPRTLESQPGDVRFEEPIYLRVDDHLLSSARVANVGHYFARSSRTDPVDHRLIGGFGSVMNHAVVRIQTTEAAVGALNTLGQFNAEEAYYHENKYEKQVWRIVKADDEHASGPIKYDEPVRLLSHNNRNLVQDIAAPPYVPKETEYLTDEPRRDQRWRIVRAASRYRIGAGLFGSGPALGVFQGQLRTAWLVNGDQIQIDGQLLEDFRSTDPPALAQYGDRLYLAYRDANDSSVRIASSTDGATFSSPIALEGARTSHAPALAVHNDWLWAVWKGWGPLGGNRLYVSVFVSGSWTPVRNVSEFMSDGAPALASFRDGLFLAWQELDSDAIMIAKHTPRGWDTSPERLPVGTSTAPALTALNDRLVCAWRGADPDPHIYMSSFTGPEWSSRGWTAQEWIAGPETHDAPALANHAEILYLGWRGRGPTLGEMFVRPFPSFY